MNYPHLAARIFNAPLMIAPDKLDAIVAGLGPRLLGTTGPDMILTERGEYATPGYVVMDGGIAVIDIFGVLAHRMKMQADSSFVMGYQTISRQLQAAMDDSAITGILLNLDTPGGEVNGAFDLADQIKRMSQAKPIWGVAADHALSAGYLIGSATQRLSVTQTGMVGSIGVVMRHTDMSRAIANDGLSVSHIYAGARKIDGSPFEPLTNGARASMQATVDQLYTKFVEFTASARGIDPAAIRDTEAGVFTGLDAIALRLADAVATPDEFLSELRDSTRSPYRAIAHSATVRSTSMSSKDTAAAGMDAPVITQADLDRTRTEAHAAGVTAGVTAERERTAAILAHSDAITQTALAHQCITSGLSAEQATAILAAAPKPVITTLEAVAHPFAAAMAGTANPSIKAGMEADPEMTEAHAVQASWARIFNPKG